MNPSASMKDRASLCMIKKALAEGKIKLETQYSRSLLVTKVAVLQWFAQF